jgi:hypothetical protein
MKLTDFLSKTKLIGNYFRNLLKINKFSEIICYFNINYENVKRKQGKGCFKSNKHLNLTLSNRKLKLRNMIRAI